MRVRTSLTFCLVVAILVSLSSYAAAQPSCGLPLACRDIVASDDFAFTLINDGTGGGTLVETTRSIAFLGRTVAISGARAVVGTQGIRSCASRGGGRVGYAVGGCSTDGDGIVGRSANGFAGFFVGDVDIDGMLTKSSGSFKIDHPLEPEKKYLYHSFVESPDMMNVYNGNVVLDESGDASVELPKWFEALNRDFRYQLTAIGAPAPNLYIAEKISNNRFKIAGGQPGMEVSWQVTGIRHDPYAAMNRVPVEQWKPEAEVGKYLHPTAYGKPQEMGVSYVPESKSSDGSAPQHTHSRLDSPARVRAIHAR